MLETIDLPARPESGEKIETIFLQTGSVRIHSKQKTVDQYGGKYEEITALYINGEKGTVDILDLLEPPKAKVLLRKPRDSRCTTDKKHNIHANWIETELDLVALLHEIGHVRQATDPKTKDLVEFETITKKVSVAYHWQKIEPYIERILIENPEQKTALGLDEETEELLEELKREQYPAFRQNQIRELLPMLPDGEEKDLLEAELDSLLDRTLDFEREVQLRTQLKPFLERAQAILYIPENQMERDATRRAFRWMREIKKRTGVDLFVKLQTKNSQRIAPNAGLDPDEEIAISAIQDLADALCTYTRRAKQSQKPN